MIHAQVLTDSSGDDAKTALKIIKKTRGKLASVTGDAAYDTVAIYDACAVQGSPFRHPDQLAFLDEGRGRLPVIGRSSR
ncbi:MAG: hypothetical protein ACI835_004519 [Planctomycetota bacterium]|jgi:hypothetical protein